MMVLAPSANSLRKRMSPGAADTLVVPLAGAGVLARGQTAPGGEIARGAELPARADGGDDGVGGEPADPGNGGQPPHHRVGLGGSHDLRLEGGDRALQSLDMAEQGLQCGPQQRRDRRIFGRDQRAQFGKATAPWGGDDAELGQLAAQAIHQLGALLDHQLARPLDPARRLLVDALDRDKAHVRTASGAQIGAELRASV